MALDLAWTWFLPCPQVMGQATHHRLFLPILTSSVLLLFIILKGFFFSIFPIFSPYICTLYMDTTVDRSYYWQIFEYPPLHAPHGMMGIMLLDVVICQDTVAWWQVGPWMSSICLHDVVWLLCGGSCVSTACLCCTVEGRAGL